MMTFSVRAATQTDARLLADIERSAAEAFLAIPDLAWIASDDVQSEARHRELIESGAAWGAVNVRAEPVGFLNGERMGSNLHILEIAVRSDLQRQGLGRALIEEVVQWAKVRDLIALTLTTFREVPWNEPFYKRLGFKTLHSSDLTNELAEVLAAEARNGLLQRCAMARQLRAC